MSASALPGAAWGHSAAARATTVLLSPPLLGSRVLLCACAVHTGKAWAASWSLDNPNKDHLSAQRAVKTHSPGLGGWWCLAGAEHSAELRAEGVSAGPWLCPHYARGCAQEVIALSVRNHINSLPSRRSAHKEAQGT